MFGLKNEVRLQRASNGLISHTVLITRNTTEKAVAPHSSALAWRIPWMEEPGGLQSMGSLRVDTTERLHFHFSLSCIGEGNGSPLQCSCLENPRSLLGCHLWGRTELDMTDMI